MNALPRVNSFLLARDAFAQLLGKAFGGKRDVYDALGYDKAIDPVNVVARYHRGGIAHRIVNAYPDATWGSPPEIESDNTAFIEAWTKLTNEFDVWTALYRLDILSRLGQYAVMLIGTDKANLETQLRGAKKLAYLQPYGQINCRVKLYETAQNNERFQLPKMYEVLGNADSSRAQDLGFQIPTSAPRRSNFDVHYSRVVHVAQGILEDETFGSSTLISVWNLLMDLEKVVGAAAENFWTSANRGMQLDVDKEMDMAPEDEKALSDEVDEYMHGLRRIIRTRGIKINTLNGDISSPKEAADVIIDLISGTTGIPRRILLGTESGHLASTQDKGNWAERVEEYRTLVATPFILDPFVWRLVDAGLLPDPGKYEYIWPDAYRLGPLERGQQSAQTSRTMSNLVRGAKEWQAMVVQRQQLETVPDPTEVEPEEPTVHEDRTPVEDDIAHESSGQQSFGGTKSGGSPANPSGGTAVNPSMMPVQFKGKLPEMLLSYDEIRGIIGLSTDNRVLDRRTRVKGRKRV